MMYYFLFGVFFCSNIVPHVNYHMPGSSASGHQGTGYAVLPIYLYSSFIPLYFWSGIFVLVQNGVVPSSHKLQ